MACGGCAARRKKETKITETDGVMGNFKYLTHKQLDARLKAYKRRNCTSCDNYFDCDYKMYISCKEGK